MLGSHTKTSQENTDVGQPNPITYQSYHDYKHTSPYSRCSLPDHICLGDCSRTFGEKRSLEQMGYPSCKQAQTASKQIQFWRLLKNAKIGHTTIFAIWSMPYLQNGEVTRFTWHWIVVACEKYSQILKDVAAILSKGCPVILLADRGFDDNDLFCAMRDLGWGFRLQLKKSLRVYRVSKPCLSVGRWIRHALTHLDYLFPFLWFELGPDPFPGIASKAQAARPIATIFGQCLEIT